MPNLTEEQIQLYQAFSRLMPGDQFVSSSGTVAVIEAIQSMIDASLLKDKAQTVNYTGPLLKDTEAYESKALAEAADRIEALETALRSIAANTCCDKCQEAALVARAALAGEKKDEKE